MSKAIPFRGALLAWAYTGHNVIVLPTYLAGHSFFDRLEPFLLIAGIIGAEAGLIAGGIIGFIVGVFGLRKLYGALTGIVVILILVVSGGSVLMSDKL